LIFHFSLSKTLFKNPFQKPFSKTLFKNPFQKPFSKTLVNLHFKIPPIEVVQKTSKLPFFTTLINLYRTVYGKRENNNNDKH
jgi:hypothetical protein